MKKKENKKKKEFHRTGHVNAALAASHLFALITLASSFPKMWSACNNQQHQSPLRMQLQYGLDLQASQPNPNLLPENDGPEAPLQKRTPQKPYLSPFSSLPAPTLTPAPAPLRGLGEISPRNSCALSDATSGPGEHLDSEALEPPCAHPVCCSGINEPEGCQPDMIALPFPLESIVSYRQASSSSLPSARLFSMDSS